MNSIKASQVADEIIRLYHEHGHQEYAGEKVSQLEHMVQAAELARLKGFSHEMVLAAFLHDIGHICVSAHLNTTMDKWGIIDHEEIGASYLRERGFSRRVTRLVESHVEAKRYLTFKTPGYFEQLSDASRHTLEFQGGRMTTEEAAAFEQYPLFEDIIQLRLLDEEAKTENADLPDLRIYRDMIIEHLTMQKNQNQ